MPRQGNEGQSLSGVIGKQKDKHPCILYHLEEHPPCLPPYPANSLLTPGTGPISTPSSYLLLSVFCLTG